MEKNSLRNQLDTTPDYIDILVAAAKLHVCVNTLRNWLRDGKLRGVKVFQLSALNVSLSLILSKTIRGLCNAIYRRI